MSAQYESDATLRPPEGSVGFADDDGVRKVFDLSSPMQMLTKLQWENDQIKLMLAVDDPKVIFAAFNAAATAWHLIEWVTTFARVYPLEEKLDIDTNTYRADAIARCPELVVCQQLSIGWKHRVVERNNPAVQALHVLDLYFKTEGGLPVDGASPARWRRRPAIYNGTKSVDLDVFFEIVTRFWSAELDRLKFIRQFTA
jgi:hypothetical protein